ncbi:hypothetical protein AVEN_180488-1 [Araneus ventricosus]|uniref:Uncharacterized protein n=1 Tax=Araneus ventricosus TaxID=182803 RepID=A0A4Y2Q8T8_ARAVE|nr:hypothetical protein AVEN_180488-1 [Araneus ventricosus]
MKLGEKACLKFCMDNGLLAKWYEYPVCGERMKLVDSDGTKVGKVWSCRKRGVNAHQIESCAKGFLVSGQPFEFGCDSVFDIYVGE